MNRTKDVLKISYKYTIVCWSSNKNKILTNTKKKLCEKIPNHQINFHSLVLIIHYTSTQKSKKKEKSEQQKQKFIAAFDIIDIEPLRIACVHKNINVKTKQKKELRIFQSWSSNLNVYWYEN